ncbi:MAG: 3-oxoacyl-[acyl-carrier-protein] reductase [Desulfobacula sp.]|nr:3-oxoacyl-[acyl-carrier-protein] reductase [Desulfobacula sp.]
MTNNCLSGKTALVTGCGRGIGKAIAMTLSNAGADIILNDIDKEAVGLLSEQINATGRRTVIHTGSIGLKKDVEKLFSIARKEFHHLDILVNNAGITRDNMLLKMTDQEWDQVIDINLKGVFYCTRQAAAMMKDQTYGRIINLTSVSALMGNPGQVNYTASKAGVIGLTKTLARELARYQITVNAVAPGFIETPMTETIPDPIKQTIISGIPLGRAGSPQDVANLVRFLSSDDSSYVTGQVISCNGGLYT